MGRKRSSPVNVLFGWLRKQNMKIKIFVGVTIGLFALIALKFTVKNHNHFFVASEAVHVAGILVLIYKLTTQKTCSGLSLKSQELTAMFLAVRLFCSTLMEEKVVPSAILAVAIHPSTRHFRVARILWALGGYMEAVSVLPQLHLMRNAKMVEPFTAHYVFALGVSRFFSCAHWILQIYETGGGYLYLVGSGYFWFLAAFLAEMVQTFILTDFCYYYMKSFMQGQLIMKMPV
ncbi:hypothetical protein G4B88_003745 [Cannabis sativa]|uniref:ER lumen protein retaining receptor n=1 Tax=Cannabis sativa TaxID=3483 RepID=A0A7J6FA07_CANSA|nr:hypothetical protein G4B88_003745 [Cannabis sativa]